MDQEQIRKASYDIAMKLAPIQWLLTFLFILLKLTNCIDWGWVWVICPLWITWALSFIFILLCLVLSIVFLVVGGTIAFFMGVFNIR